MTRSRDSPGRRGGPASRFRNTTEAINAVMYSLLSEFRDGDNVVTTTMSTTPATCRGMRCAGRSCPRSDRRVDYRLVRFDPGAGELDLDHLASLIDARTKLVCCTGRRISSTPATR
jgi:cysteine desulfurase/selenocysteine lyase